MTKGLVRSQRRGPEIEQQIVKHRLSLDAVPISVAGTSGVGFGSIAIHDFVEGNVMFFGCVANLTFSGPVGSGDLSDTWAGDYGIGTTPASDGTISAGDDDMVPSTALAAATAEVSPKTRGLQADGSLCGVIFDNTTGSLEVNLNLLVDDADISGTVAMTATGEVELSYVMLGDD